MAEKGFDFIEELGARPKLKDVKEKLTNIITFSTASSEIKENLYLYAAAIAKEMSTEVTPTQLRRFYSYIKSIELVNRHQKDDAPQIIDKYKLSFLLPKIAGSSERKKLQSLYEVMKVCLSNNNGGKIKTVADLRLFVEFFEAILDYHASQSKKSSHPDNNHGDQQ
ncbi:MAG: type III-A CRISPR-associated protein Csm2 [Desulfobulbaceae bacterium]|jgi:CRISPR type III-A-associated protein Csm2|nr:type III-A CRISPR-associated protein Csm2 [Desulfobulbaceae bacterium]